MAKNYESVGEVIQATAAADLASGAPVAVGSLVGVALTNIASGETGSVQIAGVFSLPKASAGAIAQGAKVYLTSGGIITTTASGNTAAGFAESAAADGETTVKVLLSH